MPRRRKKRKVVTENHFGESLYNMDPKEESKQRRSHLTPRWLIKRPAFSPLEHAHGYCVNEECDGILVRDELEATVLAARLGWPSPVPYGVNRDKDGNIVQAEPYNPADAELNKLPVIERRDGGSDSLELWPYNKLQQLADSLKTNPAEIPVHPTRRQLAQFIRDKRKSLKSRASNEALANIVQQAVEAGVLQV